jgi:hypothetical protein
MRSDRDGGLPYADVFVPGGKDSRFVVREVIEKKDMASAYLRVVSDEFFYVVFTVLDHARYHKVVICQIDGQWSADMLHLESNEMVTQVASRFIRKQ